MRCRMIDLAATLAVVVLGACGGDPTDTGTSPPLVETPQFVRGVGAPWGGTVSNVHETGVDLGIKRTGRAAYVRSTTAIPAGSSAFGFIAQEISAVEYRGKRLRLSGFVRADSAAGRGAGLWMRVDSPQRTTAFDNMIEYGRAIVGNADWSTYSIVLDVANDAVGITFGLLLSGTGVARVDDMSLEVVDATVPTTGSTNLPADTRDSVTLSDYYARLAHVPENLDFEGIVIVSELTSQWLRSVARPFDTDQPGSGTEDLAELGRIIGNARIAAFGEATHGSREFFRMKHRAFEYLVETRGYTHFLIEATMPEARAIDRYVATGEGDPARLLAGLYFWTWNTQEVLDLILWMRSYNVRAGEPRLRFFGVDMQFPHQALDSVSAMLGRADVRVAAQADEAVRCFDDARDPSRQLSGTRYAALPQSARSRCALLLSQLADSVAAHLDEWDGALSADDGAWLQQYITLSRQWEQMAHTADVSVVARVRDRAMADNALWIAAREPAARLFVWAHNAHVSRRPSTMGAHLARELGDAYRNVAFTFGNGRFNAITMLSSGAYGPLQVHTVSGLGSVFTMESFLFATAQPRLIFDTHKVTSREAGTFAIDRRPVLLRSIGAVYSSTNAAGYFERSLLPLDYDGIIWFVFVGESRLLPFY